MRIGALPLFVILPRAKIIPIPLQELFNPIKEELRERATILFRERHSDVRRGTLDLCQIVLHFARLIK